MFANMVVGLLLLFVGASALPRADIVVNTNLGTIRGVTSEDGQHSKFLGIPYAIVNENNPFGPATPHPGFSEPYDAISDSVVCPQTTSGGTHGELQCLQLNIYVPNTGATNLPVMVWIHGGAWVHGSGGSVEFSPTYIVNKDVIFVSINYRLGIYGFLCIDTPQVPGNQGFKDQVLALKWIRDNIVAFGGDPNQVTLFGESAGGMSVNVQLINKNEKFFDKAIIQSGPAMTTWMIVPSNNTIPIIIANELGYQTNDLSEAMAFISAQDHRVITQKSYHLLFTSTDDRNQPILKPCVEKIFDGVDNFLVDYPLNIKSDLIQSIPVMIGYNDNEVAFQYGNAPPEFFENYDFGEFLKFGIRPVNESIVKILRQFYIGDEPVGYDVRTQITDFGSDFVFSYTTERMIQKFIEQGVNDIYYYVFSYVGERNFLTVELGLDIEGASHGDELGYLFDMEMFLNNKNERDMAMVEKMTTLWTNFAKYGNPTPSPTELLPFTWSKVTNGTRPYLHLDSEVVVKNRPFNKRFAFWDLFYKVTGEYDIAYGYEPVYGEGTITEEEEEAGGDGGFSLRSNLICILIVICILKLL